MTNSVDHRPDVVALPGWTKTITGDSNYHKIHLEVEEGNMLTGLLMRVPNRIETYDVFRYGQQTEENRHSEGKKLLAFVRFGDHMCGHPGIVHGGATAAVFDDLFGWLFDYQGIKVFTAYLNTSYRSPTYVNTTLVYEMHIDKVEGRKLYAKATARDGLGPDSTLLAESEVLYIVAR
ncbi:hypothetical protein SARC_07128 [Sphaeroforma arctica JP610]|uniref:Thioesterase domain-containing protein n=1 Tax=Sphaeroforma arctica JP610 TaxID=667725 RepID=A0A0L0FVC0_9EUKA|nr:hypothetical protein SARC_07128 [Sphaeroforma arctica JP610]KNC80506.1 hypothetical protein SARC_07128 [Sphaeroforma arctica JP610]|eukprot:XP_014154408.1 hypothetical protein SARC_07128 [Sphaeroforma arctica JP610]